MSSIAIIGASNDVRKYGHAAVLAFLDAGWTVHPVNPKETEIAGLPVFASIADVPQPLDWISLYVPPQVGLELLPALKNAGATQIWLNPGTSSAELMQAAKALELPVISGCSIRAIGKDPGDFF
ncbi:MAG TPA: CoA-binding protein [Chthoniobacterales bacterium]|jgi:hypothetical protein